MNANTNDAILHLAPLDSVGVTRRYLAAPQRIRFQEGSFELTTDIPAGHKIALRALQEGEAVYKYGQIIGQASRLIRPGEHVHSHNLRVPEHLPTDPVAPEPIDFPLHEASLIPSFQGYLRPNGGVGTRNYLAILSSVNCSASVARFVRDRFRGPDVARDFPNVDGVIAFTHKSGCSLQPGEPLALLQRVLLGLARHPNIGGYLLIGLGCELNQVNDLRRELTKGASESAEEPGRFMEIQTLGGTQRTVDQATAAVQALLPQVNGFTRSRQSVSHLVLAEQCGGSDAHSGISANPALGVASDELVRCRGTAVLAETPEIYGAEHLLLRRATRASVADRLRERIRWWEEHVRQFGARIDNNPSPGNKAGGLTTIWEKSLGAVAKGGQAPLTAVYRYAEPITASGFCFMDTPGNDAVSMTGLVSGGCNVAVFTTGRGSVYGCKPTPCLKIATHTPLYQHLEDDMDLNAGTILDGTETVDQVGKRIFAKILSVAGGERTKSELAGMGDEEFAPWHLGPTL